LYYAPYLRIITGLRLSVTAFTGDMVGHLGILTLYGIIGTLNSIIKRFTARVLASSTERGLHVSGLGIWEPKQSENSTRLPNPDIPTAKSSDMHGPLYADHVPSVVHFPNVTSSYGR
jgi:hypothetical protein